MKEDQQEKFNSFIDLNRYVSGTYENADDFAKLNKEVESLEKSTKSNRLFYLALPPTVFAIVTKNIKLKCMSSK